MHVVIPYIWLILVHPQGMSSNVNIVTRAWAVVSVDGLFIKLMHMDEQPWCSCNHAADSKQQVFIGGQQTLI